MKQPEKPETEPATNFQELPSSENARITEKEELRKLWEEIEAVKRKSREREEEVNRKVGEEIGEVKRKFAKLIEGKI